MNLSNVILDLKEVQSRLGAGEFGAAERLLQAIIRNLETRNGYRV